MITLIHVLIPVSEKVGKAISINLKYFVNYKVCLELHVSQTFGMSPQEEFFIMTFSLPLSVSFCLKVIEQ